MKTSCAISDDSRPAAPAAASARGGVRLARLLRPALAACAALLCAGCPSFEPMADDTRYYTLAAAGEAGGPGAVPAAGAARVGVRVVNMAEHLQRAAMAVRVADHELAFADGHRWAEALGDAVARIVASGLQQGLGSRIDVSVTTATRASSCGRVVEIGLVACEGRREPSGAAVLVADWRVLRGADRAVLSSGRFRSERPGWDGRDFGRLAGLLRDAVDEMAVLLAAQVQAAAEAPP
jgi:uncharacterized lipoprotein YmbA